MQSLLGLCRAARRDFRDRSCQTRVKLRYQRMLRSDVPSPRNRRTLCECDGRGRHIMFSCERPRTLRHPRGGTTRWTPPPGSIPCSGPPSVLHPSRAQPSQRAIASATHVSETSIAFCPSGIEGLAPPISVMRVSSGWPARVCFDVLLRSCLYICLQLERSRTQDLERVSGARG